MPLAYIIVRDALALGMIAVILIRQEKFMSQTDDQLAQLAADEAADKGAIAEILVELKAARDGDKPIDNAALSAIIGKLEGVHASLSADNADLTGAEQPTTAG